MNTLIELLNHYGEVFVNHAQAIAVQLSVVIVMVWLLERMLRRRVRASVRYALWMLVLVKLLLPTSLASPSGLGWWLRTQHEGESRRFVVETSTAAAAVPNTAATPAAISNAPGRSATPVSVHAWLMLGSAGVSCILLAYLMFRWRAVRRMVLGSVDCEVKWNDLLRDVSQSAGLKTPIDLRLTDKAIPPSVCGLVRPVILLPVAVAEKLDAMQLKSVLLHECLHVHRGDPWVNWFQTLAQIVFWWHPLLWVANSRIRDVREEAVDEAVVVALNAAPESYASTLLEVAAHAFDKPLASLGLLGIMESQSGLRHRIQRLVTFRRPRIVGLTVLSLLLIIGIGALVIPLGSGPIDYPPTVVRSTGSPDPLAALTLTNSADSTSGVKIQLEAKFIEAETSNLKPEDTNNPLVQVSGEPEADRSVPLEVRTRLGLPQTMHADLASSQPRTRVLTDQELRTLILWAEKQSGSDILSPPTLILEDGRPGIISLREAMDVATGIDTNAVKTHVEGSNSNLYTTESVNGGIQTMITARLAENHNITLSVAAHIVEFKGFGIPTKADEITLKSDAGEKIRLTRPMPYCRVIEINAQGTLTNGQSLLIGGPGNMSTYVVKDKVPVLGDIPIIGRLFRSQSTNQVSKRVFLVVTPVVTTGGTATAAEKH